MDSQQLHLFVLAVVQGITEFLPVSSDGHILIVNALWERASGRTLDDPLGVEIILHAGTLLAILVMYWRRLLRLLSDDRHMIGRIVVGTLPAVAVGLPLHEIEALRSWLESPLLAGCLLPVTGLILLLGGRREGTIDYSQISYRQAFLIGLAQATAPLPGISRSGVTIITALALGLRREAAATFSFVLAVPAVSGAVVLGAKDLVFGSRNSVDLGPLLLAAALSFVVGLAALALLLRWLRQGRLRPMGWWCIAVGAAFTAWQLLGRPGP
ncbi:MAG TPA: undecaprenyl-diphosphate phosphatase [Pirellulales bacterium]|nr:undecaprenyl-diphosphate phosphatase [Pirellulales bacterium]